jgi:hypothetical protein
MGKRFLLFLACAVLGCSSLRAQVAPSVIGGDRHLSVGGEYSNFDPNWGLVRLPGISIYADFGNYFRRFGAEGEARFFTLTKPGGLTEKSFLIGPYATLVRRGKLSLNAKVVAGAELITYSGGIGYGSYLSFAPGADIEYRIGRKLKARVDYEYQFVPSAPGLPGIPDNGLHPNGFSGGVSYRIF